ncbi:MAG: hypothetical protein ABI537_04950 [Casimicrobiaceae bacterium]
MMATARELLEQADQLMRRNRRAESDIPVLTDSIAGVASVRRVPVPQVEIPVLTEKVEAAAVKVTLLPAKPISASSVFEGDPSDWLVMDTIDPSLHSITGGAPDTLAVVPPVTLKAPEPLSGDGESSTRVSFKAAGSAATPPPAGSIANLHSPLEPTLIPSAPAPTAPPPVAAVPMVASIPLAANETHAEPRQTSDSRWQALAEQVSMQVLQRLDLFTDTGLKDQLTHHLQPIVDRASGELVASINEQVGKLVRSYVAEAIEREIAQWRQDNH